MHRIFLLLITVTFTGCASYTQVQKKLVEQARKGVALSQTSAAGHEVVTVRLHDLQRKRLDQAFDDDVRDQKALSPDWVIEHRQAYAAAIEAMALEKQD